MNAQNFFDKGTLQSYKVAFDYALQASAYADQASAKDQAYQERQQRQHQIILIGGGNLVIVIAAIIGVDIMRRKRVGVVSKNPKII